MNELKNLIKEEILKNGPITFSEYMHHALYNPLLGYYASGNVQIGKKGDFYTSPHVSSAFGEIIGEFIVKAFNSLEVPEFTILELGAGIGAGKGYLAHDILNFLVNHNKMYNLINYVIIDKGFTNNISDSLSQHEKKIKLFNDIRELKKPFCGIIISNEFFDSLPFHRIIYKNRNFKEIYVDFRNNEFREILGEISDKEILNYISRNELDLVESKQIEVSPLVETILREINELLLQGYILTIDYGYLSEELFKNTKINGTFKCFFRHTVNENPYINIGQQDITYDVDFTNIIEIGNKIGIDKIKYTTQGQFLVDWGILNIIEREYKTLGKSNINSIKNLFMPGMMGNYFKVLLQSKNIQGADTIYPKSNLTISFGVN